MMDLAKTGTVILALALTAVAMPVSAGHGDAEGRVVVFERTFELGSQPAGESLILGDFNVEHAYLDIRLDIECPSSVGEILITPDTGQPPAGGAEGICGMGFAAGHFDPVWRAGPREFTMTAAGTGNFTVQVTGVPGVVM